MASLLPAVHGGAPILAMSGGGNATYTQAPSMSGGDASMSGSSMSLLPAIHGPLPPIPGMSGGAMSLLPIGYGDIHGMSGGGVTAASFGIVDTFPEDTKKVRAWNDTLCNEIDNRSTPVCPSLQPFVDSRVKALLKRIPPLHDNTSFNMGCGTIKRAGNTLEISFHEKAITLLSGDITGTFERFHEGVTYVPPQPAKDYWGDSDLTLFRWILGHNVTNDETFDLITFMNAMKTGTPPDLPLNGFRTFLSYHKENIQPTDVLRYAMELYGYKTGPFSKEEYDKLTEDDKKQIYAQIQHPFTITRRVGDRNAVYSKQDGSDNAHSTYQESFIVYLPTSSNILTFAKAGFAATKKSVPVTVQMQEKIGSDMYDLQGVIHHGGFIGGGHYIYLHHVGGTWTQYSDTSVTSVTEPSIMINTGYIYLFEKKDSAKGSAKGSSKGPKGIVNQGNSCWMNAAIQMFYHIPEYYDYIMSYHSVVDASEASASNVVDATVAFAKENAKKIDEITLVIQRIFQMYDDATNPSTPVTCSNEYNTLFQYAFSSEKVKSQQDAMEFITKVLLYIISPINDTDTARIEINNLFLFNEISTLACSDQSANGFEKKVDTTSLLLQIPSSPTHTLGSLLANYSTLEYVDKDTKVNGEKCAPPNTPTKMMTFTIPITNKYMIVGINRF